jgi:protocatechuate 3,4-dioxygenase beta subunit
MPGHRITTEEWMAAIEFLTRTGQTCTPLRQEFILLSDVLGVSALVDALNNPRVGTATESSVLGPFFTEDAPDGASYPRFCAKSPSPRADLPPRTSYPPTVQLGGSIASEGKGEYMYVEGHVRDTSGAPIPGAVIDTWETDSKGKRGLSSVPLFPKLMLAT